MAESGSFTHAGNITHQSIGTLIWLKVCSTICASLYRMGDQDFAEVDASKQRPV